MFATESMEELLRSKIALQERLFEVGDFPGTREIKTQIKTIELRTKAGIDRSVRIGIEETQALIFILNGISKSVGKR